MSGTRLLLVRHGQASYGADDYDVLSDVGWRQAEVLAADPHVHDDLVPDGVTRVEATPDVVASCAAVVLLVDHDAFDLAAITSGASYVLDTRHRVSGDNVEHL